MNVIFTAKVNKKNELSTTITKNFSVREFLLLILGCKYFLSRLKK